MLLVVLLGTAVAAGPARPVEAAARAAGGGGGKASTPALLDEAVARGELDQVTADEHLAEVFVGKGRSDKVPARFQSDEPWYGTLPLLRLRERLSARPASISKARTEATVAAATTCDDSGTTLPNEASSAHFFLSYGTIGGGLSANSYLTSLEASYTKQVTQFGWAAPPSLPSPPPAPIGTKYPVRADSFVGGLYGFVASVGTGAGFVGNNPNTPWNDLDAYASCMVLNRDFDPFPGTAQQALNATTAHEFNHAIQYGYGAIQGNVPDDSLFEASATLMEDEVFDDANDNYNYLWPDFRDSLGDYDRATLDDPYSLWIVLRGLTERFGTGIPGGAEQVMQDFWESISQNTGQNLGALALALENKGVTLPNAYHDAAIALGFLRTCGGGYVLPYCFEEAAGYIAAAGGLPPVAGAIAAPGASFSSTIEDDYSLAWVTLPAGSSYSVTLANTSSGGQLRATAVCDTGSSLVRAPLPAVVGPGASTTLTGFSAGSCVRRLAVITNQQQSPGNPSASPSRSFTLSTGVAGPNQPPVGNDDAYSTFAGTPLTVPAPGVLANDTDPNGNALTATSPTGQVGGTVSLNANGSFTFTPAAGFTGTGGFSYTVNDGLGGTDPATVTITVSPRPVPTVTSVSPASGPTFGGQTVTVTGTNLTSVTSVTFGGVPGSSIVRDPANPGGRLTVVTPSRPAGTVAVIVSGSFGPSAATPAAQYTFVEPPPATGYRLVASDGGIFGFGDAAFYGSTGAVALAQPIVGMAATPSGEGYWLVASDGGIFGFGDAAFFGSTGGVPLARPIVGMQATPTGQGYWLVASDGGIFGFGDAGFFGSTGAFTLAQPIVGMAATPSGRGYWLVASDGGIFGFGDAPFFGSTGAFTLAQPIVGMAATPSGRGYWLVASDGGIFSFGDAGFFGSTGAFTLTRPIVGMAATPSSRGYWLVASDGGIFSFGDAGFFGSTGAFNLARPIVGMSART